jgi:exonuclease III
MIDTIFPEFDELESSTEYPHTPFEHNIDTSITQENLGDIMDETPAVGTTRIYFQNVNGLKWDSHAGKWPYICEVLESIQADIGCFAELNTNTNEYNIRNQMENVCHKQFLQNRLILSTSKYKSKTPYKPGGTAIVARNAVTARVKSQTKDRMGRWASICIETSQTSRLRIISAYQVCSSITQGSTTAAAQQRAQIMLEQAEKRSNSRHTPREAFIHDLQSFIRQVQSEGDDIILVGDFNEEISSPASGMDQLAVACGLADLFSIRLGTTTQPATYQRGPRRIDYALISPALLECIQAAGYDPFGYRIPSDHRGFYIDFNTEQIFSQDLSPLATQDKRDFVSTSPGAVVKYVTAKMSYLTEHNFFERIQRLDESQHSNHILAESLDRDFQRASHHAAKECRRTQQAPWSPTLAEAWAELHYYKIAKSAITIPINLEPAIARLQEKWPHLPTQVPTDPNVIKQGYNVALAKLKEARQKAKSLREEFLNRRAALYTALEEKGKTKVIHRLIRAEAQHRVYTKIRHIRSQDDGPQGIASIKIPNDGDITNTENMKALPDNTTNWETITVPEEIERLLIQRNCHHFGQAEGTPFTMPPLKALIGYKAQGYTTEMILDGEFDMPNSSSATRLLIKHLQSKTTAQLDGQVQIAEVRAKLKRWKESTTTSPSGLHLGHYHCMWKDPQIHPDDDTRKQILEDQETLLGCLVKLLNYATRFGYSYERWSKVVNIMLQKDKGNPRIHRLRVIHIYEADYNLLLAIKWRQTLHHAEDNKLLNPSLYGSRPGRSAHDPALIEVLQNEIYRMSMKPGVNFDLDATSCYDRILASIASICSRRVGIDKMVALTNAQTLEHAKYHLKTSLGISQTWYQHNESKPIHGTGQGSGNSPAIWCFVCSALFDALEEKSHGATFTNYENTTKMKIHIIGFVDDCTQRVNEFESDIPPTPQQLLSTMQSDAQLWNDLLWTSGGALEQQKCSFHLIESSWNIDGHPFLKGGIQGQHIWLQDQSKSTPTHQKSNYDSHKTLGCLINPAYNHTQTWNSIQKKNESFASLLETNYFSRTEAWTFYTSIYLPSITYPLPITPLAQTQCANLDARFLRTLLPRCGYNRNMSRAVRYAPFSMGGAGFKPLYAQQGALLLQQVYKYLNEPCSQVGKLMYMTISWTQAFLGTSELFLTNVNMPLPPAPPSILLDLRQFLRSIKGHLQISSTIPSKLQRHRDRFLMDIALGQKKWDRRQLAQINSCRRYLQAQTVSDIVNLSGTKLHSHISHGEAPPNQSQRHAKFNQQRPGDKAWNTWRKFLLTLSNHKGYLTNPLGSWTRKTMEVRHFPQYSYDPEHDQLYSHIYGPHYRMHHRFTKETFLPTVYEPLIPAQGYPTAVLMVAGVMRPKKNFIAPEDSQENRTTPTTMFPSLPKWEHDLLQACVMLRPVDEIFHHLRQGTIVTCSDGSAQDKGGTFGFVIATSEGTRLLTGHGLAPGGHPNSFRSEAYGTLACFRCIYQLTKTLTITSTQSLTHHLDNRSVIRRTKRCMAATTPSPNDNLRPEHDIIKEIVTTMKMLPFKVTLKWVKGHQDTSTSPAQLSLPAQLNCEADRLAGTHPIPDNLPFTWMVPALPNSQCQLVIQGRTITSKMRHRTHEADSIPRLMEYLQSKFGWSLRTASQIDWKNYSHIIQKYKDRWTTIVKHVHDISPTGNIAHRNNHHLPHDCPACSAPWETNLHIIICPANSRSNWREATIQKISTYKSETSDPQLLDILHDGLLRLHRQLEPIPATLYSQKYHPLIESQNAIGWDQLYKGRWSLHWQELQNQFDEGRFRGPQQKPGHSWVLGIGRILIDQWLNVWKIRNEERHGKDKSAQQLIREQAILSELQELYTYQTKVCPADRQLFHSSMQAHVEQHTSLDTLENWITIHKEAILASANQARLLGIARNRTLLEFPTFNPIAPTDQEVSLTADLPAG